MSHHGLPDRIWEAIDPDIFDDDERALFSDEMVRLHDLGLIFWNEPGANGTIIIHRGESAFIAGGGAGGAGGAYDVEISPAALGRDLPGHE